MTYRTNRISLFSSVTVFCIMSFGQAALAQTANSSEDQANAPEQGEILVTARKREESLVQVPIAITSLNGAALSARGVTNFTELSNFAPGFKYQDQSVGRNDRGFQTFIMRGMNPGSDAAERASATIFVDGVPAAGGAIAGLTDVERVEVVPGPQSALFGRSTFSGAVNFITRAPGFDWKAGADLSYSSYSTVEGKASLEGPIIPDVLAVRVSGRYYSTDGQYRNPISGGRLGAQKTKSISAAFTFTPSSDLKIRGSISKWRDSDGAPASGLLYAPDYNCNAGGAPAGTLNYICGSVPGKASRLGANVNIPQSVIQSTINGIPGANIVSADFIDHIGLERKAWQASLSGEYDMGNDYTLNALYGHSDNKWAILADTTSRDTSGIPNPLYGTAPGLLPYTAVFAYVPSTQDSDYAEVRLATPSTSKLKAIVGASYYHQNVTLATNVFLTFGPLNVFPPTKATVETLGVFGSLSYDFTDSLSLSAEGRGQQDKIGQEVLLNGGDKLSAKFKSFTPRVILDFHPSPATTFYASYAKGNRPGEFNAGISGLPANVQQQIADNYDVPEAIGEEKVDMFEVGFKGDLFDKRLRILSAVYYGAWRNKHITQFVQYNNPDPLSITVYLPGGSVNLWGLELQSSFKATERLTLEGTFNYAQTDIRRTDCLECVSITGDRNPVGNRLPRYPAFSGTASINYTTPISGAYTGYARADYIYTGKQYESEANTAWTGAASKVNLRAGVTNGPYRVELFAKNLFDDKTPISASKGSDPFTGANAISFSPAYRRTIGARMAFSL
ncbi:hypothetical protein BH10PSE12_BH10PSE12_34410 [soil metagenome]